MEITQQAGGSALERAVVRCETFLRRAPRPVKFSAVAGTLVLAFVVRRAIKRRRRQNGERGDSVLGVMLKSALTAALATIPKVYFQRLAKSALHHDPAEGTEENARTPRTMPEPS